jgi:CHAT domain-containing protein
VVAPEDAKKATATFSDVGLLPPQRSEDDPTTILRQQRDLPDAEAEERRVADMGRPATSDPAVLAFFYHQRGIAAGVIAFATHGLVPGDIPGLTQPALALTAPEVAGIEGDGLLTMEKILGLRLNADWVVLSACSTGSGRGAGSEAISGLGQAFFYAGTRALLVTSWPVETTSARMLTTDLFRRQAATPTLTRARALQETMLSLMDGPGFVDAKFGRVVFSYAHPIFWAPFLLVGDGG